MPNSPRASPTEQPAKRRCYPSLRAASASALSSTRETLPFKRTSLSLPPRDTIIALVHVVVGGDTRRRYHGSNRDLLQPRRSDAFEQALPYVAFVNQSKGRESRRTRSRNIRSARTMPTLVDRRVV